eukprot:m51a1_g7654 putative domain containing protein (782) ;mRNA; f:393465-398938
MALCLTADVAQFSDLTSQEFQERFLSPAMAAFAPPEEGLPAPPSRPLPQPPVEPGGPGSHQSKSFGDPADAVDNPHALRARKSTGSISGKDRRDMAVRELIDTERVYVQDLRLLVSVYVAPIKQRRILSDEQMKAVFCSVETLLPVNVELLKALDSGVPVGKCFVKMADYLKMYINYCSNATHQAETVAALRKTNPQFEDFVKAAPQECVRSPLSKHLEIEAHLIKPEISRYSDPDEAKELEKACDKVNAVCAVVNQRKKEIESRSRLFALQERLVSKDGTPVELVKSIRHLVLEDELRESVFGNTAVPPVPMTYILLTDCLIRASKSAAAQKLVIESKTPVYLASILDVPEGEHAKLGCSPDEFVCIVSLCGESRESLDEDMQFLVFFERERDKTAWTKELIAAKNVAEERSQRPVLNRESVALAFETIDRLQGGIDLSDTATAIVERVVALRQEIRRMGSIETKIIEADIDEIKSLLGRYKGRNSKFFVKVRHLVKDIERELPSMQALLEHKCSLADLVGRIHLAALAAKTLALAELKAKTTDEQSQPYMEDFEDDEAREFWIRHMKSKAEAPRTVFLRELSDYTVKLGMDPLTERQSAILMEEIDTDMDGNVSAVELAEFTDILGLTRQLQRIKGLPFPPVLPAEPLSESVRSSSSIIVWIDENQDVGKGMQAVFMRRPGVSLISFAHSRDYATWIREHGNALFAKLRVVTTYCRQSDGGDRAADRVIRYSRKIVVSGSIWTLVMCGKGELELAKRLEDQRLGVFIGSDASQVLKFLN